MSQDKQKSIAAMRTFARDRDQLRGPVDAETSPATETKVSAAERKAHTAAAPAAIKPAPKITAQEPIPAFHELQKEVAKVAVPAIPTAPQPPKTNQKVIKNKAVGGGTIIRDTKIERTPFVNQLIASVKRWYTQTKKELAPKPKRTYAVTSAERRRGVVQKATSKSGTMFTADKDELQALIRKRQLEAPHDDNDIDLEWSPFTEPGYLLLDGEHEAIITNAAPPTPPRPPVAAPVAPPVPVSVPTPPPARVIVPPPPTIQFEPPAPPPPVMPEPAPVTAPPVPPKVVTAPVTTTPVTPVSAPTPQPQPSIPVPPAADNFDIEPDEEEPTPRVAGYWSIAHLKNLSTNEMSVLIVGFVILASVAGFAAYSTMTTTPPVAAPTEVELASLTTKTLRQIPEDTNATALQSLTAAAPAERSVELVVVTDAGDVDSTFVSALASDEAATFLRSLQEARLYITETGERVLLLQVTDPINARGGLLDWEPTLYRDLRPLLNYSVESTAATLYRDSALVAIDTRQLLAGGNPVIIYGFVRDDIVVVAPSVLAFTEAVNVIAP